MFLFVFSLFAEIIANDRPIIASYKGEIMMPVFIVSDSTIPSGVKESIRS